MLCKFEMTEVICMYFPNTQGFLSLRCLRSCDEQRIGRETAIFPVKVRLWRMTDLGECESTAKTKVTNKSDRLAMQDKLKLCVTNGWFLCCVLILRQLAWEWWVCLILVLPDQHSETRRFFEQTQFRAMYAIITERETVVIHANVCVRFVGGGIGMLK